MFCVNRLFLTLAVRKNKMEPWIHLMWYAFFIIYCACNSVSVTYQNTLGEQRWIEFTLRNVIILVAYFISDQKVYISIGPHVLFVGFSIFKLHILWLLDFPSVLFIFGYLLCWRFKNLSLFCSCKCSKSLRERVSALKGNAMFYLNGISRLSGLSKHLSMIIIIYALHF